MFLHNNNNKARLGVFLTAIALTAAFHFLVAERGYGLGMAIFFVLLVIGIYVVDLFAVKPNNGWSYIFLIPLIAAAVAESLYANEIVRFFSFPIMVLSSAMFAYWFSAPKIGFWQAPVLWPAAGVRETIWPFNGLKEFTTGLGKIGALHKILIGALIAVPFVALIGGLFASSDAVFGKAVEDMFRFSDLPNYVGRLIRDLVIGLYLLAAGWMIYTRSRDGRGAHPGPTAPMPDRTIIATVLAILNALFLVFIAVQVTAFFGGANFIVSQGITYAEYARSGFFQLLAVAGIVFLIALAVYRHTHLREMFSRVLTIALIVETGVVIASAIRRLALYIDAYGLTLSRYWAMVTIITIAVVLAFMLVGALVKLNYEPIVRVIFVGALIALPVMFLFNVEGFIVKYNLNRFVSGRTNELDLIMISTLTNDAVPQMARIFSEQNIYNSLTSRSLGNAYPGSGLTYNSVQRIVQRLNRLKNGSWTDWRFATVSDLMASQSYGGVRDTLDKLTPPAATTPLPPSYLR